MNCRNGTIGKIHMSNHRSLYKCYNILVMIVDVSLEKVVGVVFG